MLTPSLRMSDWSSCATCLVCSSCGLRVNFDLATDRSAFRLALSQNSLREFEIVGVADEIGGTAPQVARIGPGLRTA